MKPILFSKNATSFNTNGIGRLDPISAKGTEVRNGEFEIELEIAQTSKHASDIELNSIICAIPADGMSLQAFRVYKITKPINGRFKVYGQHISYQLSFIPTMPFAIEASAHACADTLAALKTNAVESCPFTFTTDVTTVSSYTQTIPASIRSRLGGVEGSVLDQFGGEYEWDNYEVKLLNHRGVQTPTVTLRYGKNITDLNQEEMIANVITGIVPFWVDAEGGERVTLPEKVVNSQYADNYPFKRTVAYDFSSAFEEKPTESQLRTKAQAYVNQAGIGVPDVSIKVSFIALADTEEYKDIAPLENVKLCDNIKIEFAEYGISTTAKVVKTEYDILAEKYISIEIGSVRSSLASTLSETNESLQQLANVTQVNFGKMANETGELIDNATAWLTQTGGVIRALKNADGEWTDLLCCSANATASTGNVFRLNVNGVGFSFTGWNGPFYQGWTLDGKILIGGTNAPSITVYDNNNNVIFQAEATKIIWDTPNTSMDAYGAITTKKTSGTYRPYVKLEAGALKFGVNNTQYAYLSEADAGDLTLHSDTAIHIEASTSTYIYSNDTDLALLADDDIEIRSLDKNINIYTDTEDIAIQSADNLGITANNDVIITATNGKMQLDGYNGVHVLDDHLYVAQTIQANDPYSIIVGDDPEIRFYDAMDNYTDDITLEGDAVIIEAEELVVRTSRSSGSYNKGYTGTFSLRTSGGGTATLNFVNGILV